MSRCVLGHSTGGAVLPPRSTVPGAAVLSVGRCPEELLDGTTMSFRGAALTFQHMASSRLLSHIPSDYWLSVEVDAKDFQVSPFQTR